MQIKITDITPFMRKGWVAMDKNGEWYWYGDEIECDANLWFGSPDYVKIDDAFDIAPADDWTKSLIAIKGDKK